MLTYNTQLKKLILPEYGRNIQRMIDRCKEIEDRKTRTECAYAIIDTMYTLFPPVGDPEEYNRKLWDHLAIMSDFDLDIDWPFEVIHPEDLETTPQPIFVDGEFKGNRQYGRYIEYMISRASEYEDGPERDALVILIANHMKKTIVTADNDVVDDERIFKDLLYMSHGAIKLDSNDVKLLEFKALPAPSKKKKKK